MSKHKDKKLTNVVDGQPVVKDTSPHIPQRDKIKNELHVYERPDFTPKQKEFIKLALDKQTKIIFCDGVSGSSKSYLSVYCALKLLNQKRVSDIIYIRSIVESSVNKMGALPGEIKDKFGPFGQPLLDKLEELLPKPEIKYLEKDNRVQLIPTNFLRGLSWNSKAIIVDEIQNCDSKELTTIITRLGEFSKMFIVGDSDQCDIRASGFKDMVETFDDEESKAQGIHVFRFSEEDCVRSGVCKFILNKIKAKKRGVFSPVILS